ncbi:MAG TPA: neutral/alkaline non-lysosomal ceramidase N-terminal domain-containing protein [Candidatus Aminicenantes bacterium]|nr:neutral/alkaline non-lysosomal ceramidase N-terminal domain-containing protein [Candidatus Aminicenantes bacterium]HRY65829.1 neutral/alkaline non-lysosomal ceramidase N-terminal domain-containing protein [Candidatus Aminicenantes bacterium]HRZ72845.1 neutral/alkaline non-lysosomal ceramidase N-terminal domain-containing protein [Candidatus Aminicenantes bacterium]
MIKKARRTRSLGLALVLGAMIALSATTACRAETAAKVGLGETIITPPVGMEMAGYRRTEPSKGVHDDLFARSLLVEGPDGTTVVLMTLSLVEVQRPWIEAIREGVASQTGIPGRNILISATHTHSGPAASGPDDPYTKTLIAKSIESAVLAWKNRVPGQIGLDSTVVMELGRANRRLDWGGLHPDPQVGLIKVADAKGKLLGVAFIYGCHPSTLDLHNLLFTEDWPYFAIRDIKAALGSDVWVAYFQSAQGDIKVGYTAELSAVGAAMPLRTWEYAELKGRQMSEAVLKALPGVQTTPVGPVKNVNGTFDYPLNLDSPLTVEEAEGQLAAVDNKLADLEKRQDAVGRRVLDRARVESFLAGMRLANAKKALDKSRPAVMKLEQQAVRIGDTAFVTFPAEVFSEIGLAVKKRSPFPRTFVIGLADESDVGYLPTAEEFKEEYYEVLGSPFSPKAEQACIEASLSLLERLK